jgi:hypothetical protein
MKDSKNKSSVAHVLTELETNMIKDLTSLLQRKSCQCTYLSSKI